MSFLLHTLLSKLAIKHNGYFALVAKHAIHILTPCNNNNNTCLFQCLPTCYSASFPFYHSDNRIQIFESCCEHESTAGCHLS